MICIMSGNLNITKIANNRDIRQAINRQLKEVLENDGYFTGWIDGEVKLERFSTGIRSCWVDVFQASFFRDTRIQWDPQRDEGTKLAYTKHLH